MRALLRRAQCLHAYKHETGGKDGFAKPHRRPSGSTVGRGLETILLQQWTAACKFTEDFQTVTGGTSPS